ncbi:MAG: septum formation initiator family protein [Nitrospinaceae bacterium]|jgi:cell division protein FtsB|nr:cell division protein FtsB [Nitrospinota bacterium]MDP6335102.1 septum formation initiator family protein [Nitrospinaceae bacterium]|tara:strand:- start:926 stop:1240 length:315 start_codon:yes stop_codon:yes gene_type:complete
MKTFNLYQQVILLAVSFFLLMMIVAVFHEDGILTIREFENELVQFKAGNETLKNENQKLRNEIDSLKSDPFAVEILAREKLNLVRPGETVYQLVPHEEKLSPAN